MNHKQPEKSRPDFLANPCHRTFFEQIIYDLRKLADGVPSDKLTAHKIRNVAAEIKGYISVAFPADPTP